MRMANSAKDIFGIKENWKLKVTLDFGDQEVIICLTKSNFSEQKLNISGYEVTGNCGN